MDKIIFNTKVLNVTLLELAECESTNDMMMKFIRSGAIEEGLLILAEHQKKGRGQRENTWESEKGKNIMMSLCLQPSFLSVQEVFYLTVIVSLSLIETLNKKKIEASIKWPNDIYVADQKICGVLIENVLKGAILTNSIVGIGLNVNQKKFIEDKPISMRQLIGRKLVIGDVLSDFVKSLDKYYTILKRGDRKVLLDLYHRYLYRKSEVHNFDDGELFEGVIEGVTTNGLLKVLKGEEVCEYSLKEIKFL